MKEYLKTLSTFLQMVRRSGRLIYGLRSVERYARSAKIIIASGTLTVEEKELLEGLAKNTRTTIVYYGDMTSAELGRTAGRRHPVKALAISSLGDADLGKLMESAQKLADQGGIEMIAAKRRSRDG